MPRSISYSMISWTIRSFDRNTFRRMGAERTAGPYPHFPVHGVSLARCLKSSETSGKVFDYHLFSLSRPRDVDRILPWWACRKGPPSKSRPVRPRSVSDYLTYARRVSRNHPAVRVIVAFMHLCYCVAVFLSDTNTRTGSNHARRAPLAIPGTGH